MTPLYAGIGGVVRELTEMYTGPGGVVKPMTEMWAGVDGVQRQIFSAGTKVGDLEIGDILQIKENGIAQNYIVVHQGKPSSSYDSSCDGTWLLRQDIAENRAWDSSLYNKLELSEIQPYLNDIWITRYDTDIRNVIKQVKIPYCVGGGSATVNSGANGLSCKIFLLSGREVGFTNNESFDFPNDGSKLDYFISGNTSSAKQRRVANLNGSATHWWLRSPTTRSYGSVFGVDPKGDYYDWGSNNPCGVRPAFVLPSDFRI